MAICKICGKPMETGVVVHKECLPRWIPVTEKLPKTHTPVLVSDSQNRVCIREHLWGGCWSQDKIDVTHWMPLPEPPEVE